MPDVRWVSGAAPVAEVRTYAFAGTWEADDLIRVIAGNKKKDFTAGSTVTNTVVSTLDTAIDALSATTYPEITSAESGVTASVAVAGTLTLTAREPGVPFVISLTPLEANGGAADAQTIEGAGTVTNGTTATTNAGPAVFGTIYNWSGDALPVDADNVFFDNSDADLLYDLDQSALEPAAIYISMTYTGLIGLPKTNDLGESYPEYRSDYFTIGPVILDIGRGTGQGSGRIKINSGSDPCAVTAHNTGRRDEPDVPAFLWKGTEATSTFTARGNADCGIAFFGGETAVVATLTVDGNASVVCGLGVTLTTINVNAGTLVVNSNIAGTITTRGGETTINGTATVAQMTCRGGRVIVNSSGTWAGNTILAGDGVLDFSDAPAAITITNPIELYGPNCRIIDPNKRIVGLVVDFNEGASEGQVVWGSHVRLSRGTPA